MLAVSIFSLAYLGIALGKIPGLVIDRVGEPAGGYRHGGVRGGDPGWGGPVHGQSYGREVPGSVFDRWQALKGMVCCPVKGRDEQDDIFRVCR